MNKDKWMEKSDWLKAGAIAAGGYLVGRLFGIPVKKKIERQWYGLGFRDGEVSAYRDVARKAMTDPAIMIDTAMKRMERDKRFDVKHF